MESWWMSPPVGMSVIQDTSTSAVSRLQECCSGSDSEDWALLQRRQQQRAHDQSLNVRLGVPPLGLGGGLEGGHGGGRCQSRMQKNETQQQQQQQTWTQKTQHSHTWTHIIQNQSHGSTPLDLHRDTKDMESPSATNPNVDPSPNLTQTPTSTPRSPLTVNANANANASTASASASASANASPQANIGRSVTSDLLHGRGAPIGAPTGAAAMLDTNMMHVSRALSPQQGSPNGDPSDPSSDQNEPAPALPPRHATPTPTPIRPRTRTMDTAMLGQRTAVPGGEFRHRVGSVSSSGSQTVSVEDQRSPMSGSEPVSYSSISSARMPDPPMSTPSSAKQKKPRKLHALKKNQPPRQPIVSTNPSIDSLPHPIRTDDASRLIWLMKRLGGQMRGELEYQGEYEGPWHNGVAYIDRERGALMFVTGPTGSFHIPLVSQLRGCKIHLTGYPDAEKECIEIVPAQPRMEVLICPRRADDREYWLAALLCWQQLPPLALNSKTSSGQPRSPGLVRFDPEMDLAKRANFHEEAKSSNVIKIGSFMLWDKGSAVSASAVIRRCSARDLQNPSRSWRRVSFALQEDGDFKLLVENSKSAVAVIQLSNLSRCAIQALDRTVLDEEYCIAIFPIYASSSTHLSIFRPVYLALDSRIDFEVWFVLLRTFAVPDLYHLEHLQKDDISEIADVDEEDADSNELFRLEKVIRIRVTEAKMKAKAAGSESPSLDKFDAVDRRMDRKLESDPFIGNYAAEVILDGELRARTTTKMDTRNPFWREDCDLSDLPPAVHELSIVLKRVVIVPDAHSKVGSPQEVVCGTVAIALDELQKGQPNEQWLPIMDAGQQSIGSMLVRVCIEEHVALLAKEYEPLAEMLQRSSSSLTTQIASSVPSQLRYVSELLLNIFQASGTASEWLMDLVEDEIDGIGNQATMKKYRFGSRLTSNESNESPLVVNERELMVRDMSKSLAGEANLLFRGNTLLTQALEFHMRRLGMDYLEEVLRDKIREINELDPDCEVDRSKLHHLSSGELDHHWHRLNNLTNEIWQCIADSAEQLPNELRHILKYVRAVAEDRYGDFFRTVNYTSVSGFLFLRFICPAILSPKLFGLLRDHPKPRAQRTLTLIAKTLQKLSNISTFGKREEYMEPMNRFLNQQRKNFRDFIDHVCGIPAERGYKALPPQYSTPVTILNRMRPTAPAREGFPSLPYLIDRARSFAALVKLWVDSHPLEGKLGQTEAELTKFNDLCFGLQKRADACLAKVVEARNKEASRKSIDLLSEVCEAVNISGLYVDVSQKHGGSGRLSPIAHYNDHELAPGSSGSEGPLDLSSLGRDFMAQGYDGRKSSVSGAQGGGTLRAKNPKMGRTLLNGIMRMGGRAESPESKGQR